MTVKLRMILIMLSMGILTGCETLYLDQTTQPPPVYVSPQPVVVSPPGVYPSQPQPAQVPVPIQTPPLPPSVPSKSVTQAPQATKPKLPAVIPANQPISSGDMPVMHTAPEKPPGSMSELPDPS